MYLVLALIAVVLASFLHAQNPSPQSKNPPPFFNEKCQSGHTWRDMEYVYHCTAEKRP
jgi:hypothetical protein